MYGLASRDKRGVSALVGRHLDHTLGEASRPHTGGGISIAPRREAFQSPRGGKHQRVAGSSSMVCLLFLFCVCGCACVFAGDAEWFVKRHDYIVIPPRTVETEERG